MTESNGRSFTNQHLTPVQAAALDFTGARDGVGDTLPGSKHGRDFDGAPIEDTADSPLQSGWISLREIYENGITDRSVVNISLREISWFIERFWTRRDQQSWLAENCLPAIGRVQV